VIVNHVQRMLSNLNRKSINVYIIC
jgi:hypothetical protein